MLPHIRGKNLVEFGTRSGDGICCFAVVARRAAAVEFDTTYCSKLEERAKALQAATNSSFRTHCKKYQNVALDNADVFTWWFGGKGLDSAALLHLRMRHDAGQLRHNASAIVLFERDSESDMVSFKALESFASWVENVTFDEHRLCLQKYPRKRWLCARSSGSYHLAGFRIADVPISVQRGDPDARNVDNATFAKRERNIG